MRKRGSRFLSENSQSGQSIVEYVILMLVAISVVAVIGTGFRRTIFRMWFFYTKKIAPACPDGCSQDENIRQLAQ